MSWTAEQRTGFPAEEGAQVRTGRRERDNEETSQVVGAVREPGGICDQRERRPRP